MPRFLYTPNDYSPTYDIESDGNRGFVRLHAIWDIPPAWPQARQIPVSQDYIDYIGGIGWGKLLEHFDSLGRKI
jgi:hypothetical protein